MFTKGLLCVGSENNSHSNNNKNSTTNNNNSRGKSSSSSSSGVLMTHRQGSVLGSTFAMRRVSELLFFSFRLYHVTCRMEPVPLQWKHRFLTIRSPGKPLDVSFLMVEEIGSQCLRNETSTPTLDHQNCYLSVSRWCGRC